MSETTNELLKLVMSDMRRVVDLCDAPPGYHSDFVRGQIMEVAQASLHNAEQILARAPAPDGVREALEQIKKLVCGDRLPNWDNGDRTYATRGTIADICDEALGNLAPGWKTKAALKPAGGE